MACRKVAERSDVEGNRGVSGVSMGMMMEWVSVIIETLKPNI